ncbi:MAG TPA: hypothetical protein VM511_01110, partial [Luteolibacter sp.]|nr:hypothetical protein [Luteolibacter sp.]
MKLPATCALIGLSFAALSFAKEGPSGSVGPAAAPAAPAEATPAPAPPPVPAASPASQLDAVVTSNKLDTERVFAESAALRAEIARLKVERELITERLALESAKRSEAEAKNGSEKEKLTTEGYIAKLKADKLTNELKSLQTEALIETTRLQND